MSKKLKKKKSESRSVTVVFERSVAVFERALVVESDYYEGELTREQTRRAIVELTGKGGLTEDQLEEGVNALEKLFISAVLWDLWADGSYRFRWDTDTHQLRLWKAKS